MPCARGSCWSSLHQAALGRRRSRSLLKEERKLLPAVLIVGSLEGKQGFARGNHSSGESTARTATSARAQLRDPPGHRPPRAATTDVPVGERAPRDAGCLGAERAEERDCRAVAGHTQCKRFPVPMREETRVAVAIATPLFKHCC